MSRDFSLPAGVVTAATAPSYDARHAVRIGISPPLLLWEGPGSLTINGEPYSEGLISLGAVQVGVNPALTVRVRNGANEISAVDADSDGLRDVQVLVYEVMWDPATHAQLDPVLLFSGVVNQPQYVGGYADLQCVSRVQGQATAGMVGRYVGRPCGHVYKGPRCGYSGSATACDHTMATCQALGNFARFGGFPSVPAVGTTFKYKVLNGTTLVQIAGRPATVSVPPNIPSGGAATGSLGGNGTTVRRHLGRA